MSELIAAAEPPARQRCQNCKLRGTSPEDKNATSVLLALQSAHRKTEPMQALWSE
jgi:hypothetical protein